MKVEKESLFKFLRKLSKELNSRFSDLKTEFQRSPPPNNEIKKRFLQWRSKYDQVVISTIKEVQDIDEKTFNFKDFIVKATQEFGTDLQFLELLKAVNASIQILKDFIRMHLIRDPSIYEIRE